MALHICIMYIIPFIKDRIIMMRFGCRRAGIIHKSNKSIATSNPFIIINSKEYSIQDFAKSGC
jgi:hypothetical protein